jgi:hypothetical protein
VGRHPHGYYGLSAPLLVLVISRPTIQGSLQIYRDLKWNQLEVPALLMSQVLCGFRCPFDPLTWRTRRGTRLVGCKAREAPALPEAIFRLRGRRIRSLVCTYFVPLPLSHLIGEVHGYRVSRVRQFSLTIAASVTLASWEYGSPSPLARVPPKLDLMPATRGYPGSIGEVRTHPPYRM